MEELDMTVLENVDDDIQRIAEPLVQRREKVLAHRASLMEARERSDEVLRRIEKALRPLRPDLFETNRQPSKRRSSGQGRIGQKTAAGTSTGHGITVEACVPYVNEIEAQVNGGAEYVTQIGVYRKIADGNQTRASAVFRYLREIGFLRKGGIKDRREAWYIDNPAAFAKAVKELEEANA